jgi:hypothetical protein
MNLLTISAFVLNVSPLVYIGIQTLLLKDQVRLIALESVRKRQDVTTVSFFNTTTTDTIQVFLEPEILIPLLVGTIIVATLILIAFLLCTSERSNAISRVIYSLRGTTTQQENDVVINIQENSNKPKRATEKNENEKTVPANMANSRVSTNV